jgi:hypothetical protein
MHFCVNKKDRSLTNAARLIKTFKRLLLKKGYLRYIAEVPREAPYLLAWIKYLGGVEPYYQKDGDDFYFLETRRHHENI